MKKEDEKWSLSQPHDSFDWGESFSESTYRERLKLERLGEIGIARRGLAAIADYQRLKQLSESGIVLDLEDAAALAAIEGSVIYLTDPTRMAIHEATPGVYRQVRTLELMGIIKKSSLSGNILLIGSHQSRHEVQGLNAEVSILDPELYYEAASLLLESMQRHVDKGAADYFGATLTDPEIGNSWSRVRANTYVGGRLSSHQWVTCVEPEEGALNFYRMHANALPSDLDFANVVLRNETIGDFIESGLSDKFSLIMMRRTDPDMWGEGIGSVDVKERVLKLLPLLNGDKSAFRKEYKKDRETFKSIHRNLRFILNGLARNAMEGTQLYISTGWGNSENDFNQREAMMAHIGTDLRGMGMNPQSIRIHELIETGFLETVDVDVSTIVADFNLQSLKRLGSSHNVDEGNLDTKSGTKKRRRRH